jgi:hypothetical protein
MSEVEARKVRKRTISLPLPPAWLVAQVLLFGLLAGLVLADREHWHWYASDTDEVAQLHARVASLRADNDALARRVDRLPRASATSYTWIDDPESAIGRLSASVAVLSLLNAYGGSQSAGSPQGKACVDYLMTGTGTFAECGFRRVE